MLNIRVAITLVCVFVSPLGAGLGEKPLSLRQVEDLVEAKVDRTRVAEAIRSRGVDFLASDDCLGFFRGLGASPDVESALRMAGQAPFSKEALLREIAGKPEGESLAESVETRGINFHPTSDDLDTLKVAGAPAGVIASVRSAALRSEDQFEACPPETEKTRTAASPAAVESVAPPKEPKAPEAVEPARGGEPAKTSPVVSTEVTASPKLVGGLDIITEPPGLEVLIDGRSYGPSPIHTALSEGDHTYRVKPAGLRAFEKKFTITAGTIRILHVSFVPLPVPPTGTLVVETNPPGAAVELDGGSFEGWTPATFELAAGPHQLRLSLDGYRPVTRAVRLDADHTLTLRQNLQRAVKRVRPAAARAGK